MVAFADKTAERIQPNIEIPVQEELPEIMPYETTNFNTVNIDFEVPTGSNEPIDLENSLPVPEDPMNLPMSNQSLTRAAKVKAKNNIKAWVAEGTV